MECITNWRKRFGWESIKAQYNCCNGDARLRRRRLVPECEPRGADLVKPAQKLKCQSHFLRCYAPRCLSDGVTVGLNRGRVRRSRTPPGERIGRHKGGVPHRMSLKVRKRAFGSKRLVEGNPCRMGYLQWHRSLGYARRFPRVESFGRGFDSRHLHHFPPLCRKVVSDFSAQLFSFSQLIWGTILKIYNGSHIWPLNTIISFFLSCYHSSF